MADHEHFAKPGLAKNERGGRWVKTVNNTEKAKLRKWAKELRQTLDLKEKTKKIIEKIQDLNEYKSAKTVMSYFGKDIEISLNDLFNDTTKSWFLPVVKKDSIVAVPYILNETKLTKGAFGILEPEVAEHEIEKARLINLAFDLIFVPGLCFDKSGNRLGFGLGYYDKFLKLNPSSFKIGCCPKDCLIDNLPTESWDEKVDLVITD